MTLRSLALLATVFLITFEASAKKKAAADVGSVWDDRSTIELELKVDFAGLFAKQRTLKVPRGRQSADGPEAFVPGEMTFSNGAAGPITLPVKIRVRGASTRGNCSFPKLDVDFVDPNDPTSIFNPKGTIFASNKQFKVGTHCNEGTNLDGLLLTSANQIETHREAFAYHIQEILGLPALKSRPAVITYIESSTGAAVTRNAFLLESPGRFAKRVDATQIYIKGSEQYDAQVKKLQAEGKAVTADFKSAQDTKDFDQAMLMLAFENMIGNSDYSFPLFNGEDEDLWNIKTFARTDGSQFMMAIDLNLANLVVRSGNAGLSIEEAKGQLDTINDPDVKSKFMASLHKALATILEKKAEILKALDTADLNYIDPATGLLTHDKIGDEGMRKGLNDVFEQISNDLRH